jgi:hypothetical protein
MPFTGDPGQLGKVRGAFGRTEQAIQTTVKRSGHQLLREQGAKGIDPAGRIHKLRKDGEPALVSKKLPTAFTSVWSGRSLRYVGRTGQREILRAHNDGHTWPARSVSARKTVLRYNSKGKLVRSARFARLKRGRAVFAGAHTVGRRVLPQRRIAPDGALPPRWQRKISTETAAVITKTLKP